MGRYSPVCVLTVPKGWITTLCRAQGWLDPLEAILVWPRILELFPRKRLQDWVWSCRAVEIRRD